MTQQEPREVQPLVMGEALPPVSEASLIAARAVFDPLMAELSNPTSVLYEVAADRASRMPEDAKLGISPSLLVDPTRSGIVVPRYQLQGGELPANVRVTTPEQAVVLWTVQSKDSVPKLRVPEGKGQAVMEVADKMQMRGGGLVIFAREEAAQVPVSPRTLIKIDGAARNANRERITTALALSGEIEDYTRPILATVDPTRILRDDERQVVQSFAPNALNEQELFIDSARDKGFELDKDGYGARYLPDGSTYVTMTHGQSGRRMVVLAPRKYDNQNGVYNGYQALVKHGSELPGMQGFEFNGTDLVAVTSSHYGPMSVMNSLRAAHTLRVDLGSYRVIGDNQPTRKEQAHLIEIGLTLDAAAKAMQDPAIKAALLQEAV